MKAVHVFVCGKDMVVPDTLSKAPLNQDSNETLENEVSFYVQSQSYGNTMPDLSNLSHFPENK